jgi:ABC-type spermidine/putrescine transport system permease subunit I
MVTTRERRSTNDNMVTGHLLIMISIGVAVGILILIGVLFFIGLNEVEPTSPTLEELGSVVGNENAVQTYQQLREERFESIKDLLQLMVIALAVPMLAIVLGYFSERQPKAERVRRENKRAVAAEALEDSRDPESSTRN